MKWNEVLIKTTTEATEAVSSILYEVGVGGVVIEDSKDFYFQDREENDWDYADKNAFLTDYEGVIIKAYFSEDKNIMYISEIIKEKMKLLPSYGLDIGEGSVQMGSVDEQDWANNWKKYYKPTKVSDSLVIKPTWEDYKKEQGEIIIELDPGMAFGTGTHETTKMCLRNIEKYLKKDDIVFDIGCGSGILAIGAAKLNAKEVIAVDLDEKAYRASLENAKLNNVEEKIEVLHGNLTDVIGDKKADIIVANIIADIIALLSKDIANFMKEDSLFISSGIILDKIDFVKEALLENDFEILKVDQLGEWACIVAKKGE